MTSSDLWDQETAERYDDSTAAMSDPAVLDPAVDFLAQLAGMELEQRVAGWDSSTFTAESESHVSVWRKPA
ncbi:MAG: hypothetical protein Q8O61_07175 [Nocardioides sp.]|nr:hypothetical protein [Nocardioides sp.]